MLSSLCFCVYVKVVTLVCKRKISLEFLSKDGRRPFGLAMCSSAAQPQTKAVRPQGRANSELRNVAPQGRRPQRRPQNQNIKKGRNRLTVERVIFCLEFARKKRNFCGGRKGLFLKSSSEKRKKITTFVA
ncbi:hypothetical protein SGRA_0587 [Saprospira grandis str. Lewin]|uniref:Uncharacterized protein n=1 Tax=Saprospira grandis (strain Lewin) TaxID=984262 RepID=H6KZ42_SAPGL|nr:hypothetical protein SGRA_0587 [Saprospira grandis str. Lewin]